LQYITAIVTVEVIPLNPLAKLDFKLICHTLACFPPFYSSDTDATLPGLLNSR
jgi:hypothetical protein